MTTNKLAIIGGSGLYDVEEFKERELIEVNTPWGKPSDQILKTNYKNKEIYFLPRHGRGHFISPSNINFRANIDALKQLGVTDIVSVSAVGSLKEDLPPGKFVIVDQFIDRTFSRIKTFFEDEIVAHVSMAHPTSNGLMNACEDAIKKSNIDYQRNGTYVVMEGPQFSTLAESNLYRSWKADVIGMTNMPEAKLAREAEIRYASVSMVTDFDCWHPDHENVDVQQVIKVLLGNAEKAKVMIKNENAFAETINQIVERSKKYNFTKIAAIESRGFVFASAVSYLLKKPFIMLRKKNKLPADVHSVDFELEYGTATIEVHKDSLNENDSVLIIDDLIATGGTAEAAAKLVEISNGKVAAFIFVINLFDLGGSYNLIENNYKVESLIDFPGH